MARRVLVTGLGPISALGLGIEATWQGLQAGAPAFGPITAFDPGGFDCQIAGQVPSFAIRDFVPKTYRKATKVMARDIELAVAAADLAARDAGLQTSGTAEDKAQGLSYPSARVGAHIGAGLIAADLNELTAALARSCAGDGPSAEAPMAGFDLHRWGREGMTHLTPLWLLKYLPNMLACHVTIIHDAQGPSNTITCGEASAGLSCGESLRVIQRGQADLCFCGGAESKLNPMAYLRQQLTGRLLPAGVAAPRPFDQATEGQVVGEGGGIVILEAAETFEKRGGRAYASVLGFGASQTVNRAKRNLEPTEDGRAIAGAIRTAIREAGIGPQAIDLIVPFGSGAPVWDQAEAAALRGIFGDRLAEVPLLPVKAYAGNTGAGCGGLEVAIAAKCLAEQWVPPIIHRDRPLAGLSGERPGGATPLRHVLVYAAGYGGQNTAMVLGAI